MDDKRMAGAYEIILAAPVGTTEIVLGHCPDNEQFPYMVGHCTQNPLFASYHCCTYGDSYLEILKTFADEAVKAVHSLEQELAAEKMVSDNQYPFNTKRCLETDGCHLAIPSDEFFQKVIVIKPEVLKPEFQLPTRQLYVCTGGFGAYPKSRGSACFCTSLYSGKHTRFEREDILATMDVKAVPQWAQENLRKVLSEEKKLNQKKEVAR